MDDFVIFLMRRSYSALYEEARIIVSHKSYPTFEQKAGAQLSEESAKLLMCVAVESVNGARGMMDLESMQEITPQQGPNGDHLLASEPAPSTET